MTKKTMKDKVANPYPDCVAATEQEVRENTETRNKIAAMFEKHKDSLPD